MFFRNKEIKTAAVILIVLTGGFSIIGFYVNQITGILTMAVCVSFSAVFYLLTRNRYNEIKLLSFEIDRLLHREERFGFDGFYEGELAVLSAEIRKMLVRMREQSEQLGQEKAFLSQSLADIAHQLRTPLTSVSLLASFLAEPDLDSESRLRFANEMRILLTRIEWLITSLLKISKLDAGNVIFTNTRFTVRELIERSAEPLMIPLELKNIELRISGDDSAVLRGDIKWISEAVGNILKNCSEHTESGGRINIKYSENAIYTEFIISDTGGGFAAEDLPRLFERFFQGKNPKESSFGIGLALARTILSEQNATIKAHNNENGAVFTIKFYQKTNDERQSGQLTIKTTPSP